jgi:hypothetical protein
MKINLSDACFIKWGCVKCRALADEMFKNTGTYIPYECINLSFEEKKQKILERYNADAFEE